MLHFVSAARFVWIANARNTIKELQSTFCAPYAIAKELQAMIAAGAGVKECNTLASASLQMRQQIGA